MTKHQDVNTPDAIIGGTTEARLDAMRRHGGKPKSTQPINGRVVTPSPKPGHREGQLTFDEERTGS